MSNNNDKTFLDLLPFLAEAFSTNTKAYKLIDKVYNTDKIRFITKAKENKWYNSFIAREGSIEQEYYFKKAMGLILVAQKDEYITNELLNIIAKGWRYAYTYVEQHDVLNLYHFISSYIKKKRGIDNVVDDELNSNGLMLIFLSTMYKGKTLDKDDKLYNNVINTYFQRLIHMKNECRIGIDNISKEKKRFIRDLELKLKTHNKIKITPSSYQFSDEQRDGMMIIPEKMSKDDKFFSSFEYIFDYERISLISIVGADYLSSKELQELIYAYSQFHDSENIDYDEFLKYIYPAIQIRYLCKEYKKAKKYFFENFDEQLYDEISKTENENRELKKSNLLLQDENGKLKREIELLKSKNNKLQDENTKLNTSKSELFALRNFVFEQSIQDNKNTTESNINNIDMSKLNGVKGVIIGGRNSLQQKIKNILPNWNFISVDTLNFDTDILKNANYIFLNVNVLSHAMYYKVTETTNKIDKDIHFLNNDNVDICLKEMYKKIQDKI
ncbi:hypothetical protein G8V07_11450 [Clostridium botulinum D/C]|uniref:hypothetical protein n=1 Tax=Clostridium botulinum TaxID=1491 RepID=UPI001E3B9C6C|nr:hypothetical protein [Clostridium botulinum]MCD3319500.1 hypothetical protein [Clostridium botulinum D/C]MCD3324365.1 hypothetical protein [Clostridium botulinum D/C]MCD3327366.1 hypothetical protein [Clostridium botulinum D/C]